ncbi:hypothetical protein L6452_21819 [Arctium lappa]|uniref:Uncharacterized protein n=1 Tax=Arctium lappa TaxID=4217 RepID=A0ACB9AXQ0_ARCLA|nr:hypothetical protein L6452_21819 [Arctium lappa]
MFCFVFFLGEVINWKMFASVCLTTPVHCNERIIDDGEVVKETDDEALKEIDGEILKETDDDDDDEVVKDTDYESFVGSN